MILVYFLTAENEKGNQNYMDRPWHFNKALTCNNNGFYSHKMEEYSGLVLQMHPLFSVEIHFQPFGTMHPP